MIQLEISVCMVLAVLVYQVVKWVQCAGGQGRNSTEGGTKSLKPGQSVTFLVPAWNSADAIPVFVESFLKLNVRNKQLVLCAGGADGSYDVARRFQSHRVLVLEQRPGVGKQGALRQSFPHSTGEVIFLTDIDCELTGRTVTGLMSELSHDCPVTTGGIRPQRSQLNNPIVLIQWAVRSVSSPQQVTETFGILGANTAVLREALEKLGGFTTDAPSGTDYTLAKELIAHGYPIKYVPDCDMTTEFPDSWTAYTRKQTRWLRNILVIAPRYRAWREVLGVVLTLAVPFVYLLMLFVGFVLPVCWTLVGLALIQATMNRLRYVRSINRRVGLGATFSTVLGDLWASIVAVYQWMRKNYAW